MAERQVEQQICAALFCRRRKGLVRRRTVTLGLLVDILLCSEHEAEEDAALHRIFRENFGLDFVDPERN